jgi:hypothetical protein
MQFTAPTRLKTRKLKVISFFRRSNGSEVYPQGNLYVNKTPSGFFFSFCFFEKKSIFL